MMVIIPYRAVPSSNSCQFSTGGGGGGYGTTKAISQDGPRREALARKEKVTPSRDHHIYVSSDHEAAKDAYALGIF